MTALADAITAIRDDLIANVAALTDVATWRFHEPAHLSADDAPYLAVYARSSPHALVATLNYYTVGHAVRVDYAVNAVAAQEGGGDEDMAETALNDAQSVVDRLQSYASGLPSPAGDLYGVLGSVTYRLTPAFVWLARIDLTIEEIS